jgi:hypothetical protein
LSLSEKHPEYRKLEEVSRSLDRAESYWIQFCEDMAYVEKTLSSLTPASVGQKTTLLQLLQMWQRAANVSMQRFQKLADMARRLLPSETSPPVQSLETRWASQASESDQQRSPDSIQEPE